jgi:hypothetical protein
MTPEQLQGKEARTPVATCSLLCPTKPLLPATIQRAIHQPRVRISRINAKPHTGHLKAGGP